MPARHQMGGHDRRPDHTHGRTVEHRSVQGDRFDPGHVGKPALGGGQRPVGVDRMASVGVLIRIQQGAGCVRLHDELVRRRVLQGFQRRRLVRARRPHLHRRNRSRPVGHDPRTRRAHADAQVRRGHSGIEPVHHHGRHIRPQSRQAGRGHAVVDGEDHRVRIGRRGRRRRAGAAQILRLVRPVLGEGLFDERGRRPAVLPELSERAAPVG